VFLSHSGLQGIVGDTIDALVAALTPQAGFEVLIDRDGIPLGTGFRGQVEAFIAQCDAAVVLIGRRALEAGHPWVRTEAAKLGSRVAADKTFQLVPVFLEGVQPAQLRGGEWEPVELAAQNGVVDDDPGRIAELIRERLEPTRLRVAAGAVERGLAALLREVPERTLMDGAQTLMAGAPLAFAGEPASAVARRLLGAPLTVDTAVEFIRSWLLTNPKAAIMVLRSVLPYTWVDAEAAACIPPAVRRHRPIGLNTASPATSRAYLARASEAWPQWQSRDVLPEGDDVAEIRRAVGRAIGDAIGDPDLEDIADIPADEFDADEPLFLSVPCPCFDEEIVNAFDDLPTGVALILLGGAITWKDVAPPGVEYVRPELEEEAERAAHAATRAARRRVKRFLEAGGLPLSHNLDW
jgi:hypothetical protein